MPRLINPVEWSLQPARLDDACSPLLSLENGKGNRFHIQPIESGLVRVVHSLPFLPTTLPRLRNHDRREEGAGVDGFVWERRRHGDWQVRVDEQSKQATIRRDSSISSSNAGRRLVIHIDYSHTVRISWYWEQEIGNGIRDASSSSSLSSAEPFLCDFKSAYMYDIRTQRVYHQVCRQQSYMPLSEHALSANENHVSQKERFEFVYGLGESKGSMMKDGKRYLMDARDSLAADPQETDPLYKLCPFYLHYHRKTDFWYGLFYNTLSPSIFDFSGEHDFATGEFRSFSAESGPLDYYLLLGTDDDGDSQRENTRPTLPSIISQLARLVTPYSSGPTGCAQTGWQASSTLPPLNQFGYLASSLTLSEREDAQQAIIGYVEEARLNGFPIDAMHLSSGYAVDSATGERNYFVWDSKKYPDPVALGKKLERELHCKIIINVKPWLLETHPSYTETAAKSAFVRAAPDARPDDTRTSNQGRDEDRCGSDDSHPARTMHWSKGMGVTGKGSFFDFSSHSACREWQRLMSEGVLSKSITGIWIDNNEFSSLIDDEEEIRGQIELWTVPTSIVTNTIEGTKAEQAAEVANRMGWGRRPTPVGSVGRGVLTMGMARATYHHLYHQLPNQRPVIVTRSAVPGMQAFAHATWSGDNSTSWLSLKWSNKVTLSYGLSFGLGLYGHDVGGFAGEHSPSPELLIRWCQQSMWHTRFTIHSWKKITTTPWMYDDKVTGVIREIIHRRYQLIPMLYSFYVTHYHRRGWPVIKPLLWYHSKDFHCLTQDEQFLVGSHVLVAPVCDFARTSMTLHLPCKVDDDDRDDACWYEMHADRWHRPSRDGQQVTLGE
jgi:alpha-glucosidase